MEYLIHIKPTFNCLLKVNNLEQILNKDKMHTFIIKDKDLLPLYFYPTESTPNSLPFACMIKYIKRGRKYATSDNKTRYYENEG